MYLWLCIKNVDIKGSVHDSFLEYAQGQMITKMFWNKHTKEPKQSLINISNKPSQYRNTDYRVMMPRELDVLNHK